MTTTTLTQDILATVRSMPNVQEAYIFNGEIWFWGSGNKKTLTDNLKPLSSDGVVGIFENTDENSYRSQWKGNFTPKEFDNSIN
jgi:hypothetical protein